MNSVDVLALVFVYIVGGVFATFNPAVFYAMDDFTDTREAHVALGTIVFLLWPLTLVYGLWRFARCLIAGFVDLWHQIRPPRVEVPRAAVHQRKDKP